MKHAWSLSLLVVVLSACSIEERAIGTSCHSQFLYNSGRTSDAIREMESLGQIRNYVVANKLAELLILRGSETGSPIDFDRASDILTSIEMPERPHPLIVKWIGSLRFLATHNGSHPTQKPPAVYLGCTGDSLSATSKECADAAASEVFEQLRTIDGYDSKSYSNLLALYQVSYRATYKAEFYPKFGEFSLAAEPLSSCSATGKTSPD